MIPEDIQKGIDITIEVLRRMHPEFNPNDDKTYVGLCNEASGIFLSIMKKLYGEDGELIHGEIRHNSNTKSSYWDVEHTWVKYKKYYIDITCGQFRGIIKDIPSNYIGRVEPRWFIKDKDNLALKSDLCMKLLYKIKAPISDLIHKIKVRGGK